MKMKTENAERRQKMESHFKESDKAMVNESDSLIRKLIIESETQFNQRPNSIRNDATASRQSGQAVEAIKGDRLFALQCKL